MSTLTPAFARKMKRRQPLSLEPARSFAIKRNLHEWIIDAEASRFAATFAEVMQEPGAQFGAIEVKRLPGREGLPFTVGERFSGCVKLSQLGFGRLGRTRLGAWLEDAVMSDFAEIVEVAPLRVVYRYLSGCPMAGSSTFLVEPLGDRCRLRVIFEYQERGGLAISVLNRFGIQMHDRVTRAQVAKAAERLGVSVLSSTLCVE